jgi:Protein of unknown function (DUF4238)
MAHRAGILAAVMHPKRQHYVPRFLLRNFAPAGEEQVHVYDKKNDRVFRAHIANVAAESGFYDFRIGDEVFSIEAGLGELEDSAAPILRGVIKEQSLAHLSERDFVVIARFVAAQVMRTPSLIAQSDRVAEQIRQRLRESGDDPDLVPQLQPLTPEERRRLSASFVQDSAAFVPLLLDKLWMLARTDTAPGFYISDNPVTLHNSRRVGPRGNLGLAVPGIEIYLPLSGHLCLAMYCRTLFVDLPGAEDGTLERLRRAAANGGQAVPLRPEHLIFSNSLQVGFASRFLFSRTGDFGLVREMLAKHPNVRQGWGPELA